MESKQSKTKKKKIYIFCRIFQRNSLVAMRIHFSITLFAALIDVQHIRKSTLVAFSPHICFCIKYVSRVDFFPDFLCVFFSFRMFAGHLIVVLLIRFYLACKIPILLLLLFNGLRAKHFSKLYAKWVWFFSFFHFSEFVHVEVSQQTIFSGNAVIPSKVRTSYANQFPKLSKP